MTDPDTAIVRMYNVGFGDSILLDLPSSTGDRTLILVDCGSVAFGDSGQNTEGVVKRIIADVVASVGEPRIDVVVATHRHRDHISGFGRPEWREVRVGEVWQPWTENPDDAEARSLRQAQLALAQAIEDSAARLAGDSDIDGASRELILAMGANAAANEAATSTLRSGFASHPKPRRRYLARQRRPLRCGLPDGITVHVLGPSRSTEIIKDMNPPSGQSYLALFPVMGGDAGGDVAAADRPFPALAPMTYEEYAAPIWNAGEQRSLKAGQAIGQLRDLVRSDSLLSAAVLDHALNNTSLMLMFEIGNQFLLFPGDAQWGSWNKALSDDWSADLLSRTTFYKVGHHGSHNATPAGFVEETMPEACWAVASVGKYSRWERIPKPELLEALSNRSPGRVFTTMDPPDAPPPELVVIDGGVALEFRLPI